MVQSSVSSSSSCYIWTWWCIFPHRLCHICICIPMTQNVNIGLLFMLNGKYSKWVWFFSHVDNVKHFTTMKMQRKKDKFSKWPASVYEHRHEKKFSQITSTLPTLPATASSVTTTSGLPKHQGLKVIWCISPDSTPLLWPFDRSVFLFDCFCGAMYLARPLEPRMCRSETSGLKWGFFFLSLSISLDPPNVLPRVENHWTGVGEKARGRGGGKLNPASY